MMKDIDNLGKVVKSGKGFHLHSTKLIFWKCSQKFLTLSSLEKNIIGTKSKINGAKTKIFLEKLGILPLMMKTSSTYFFCTPKILFRYNFLGVLSGFFLYFLISVYCFFAFEVKSSQVSFFIGMI